MNKIDSLLEKYNNGTATKEEIILVESWYTHYKTAESDLNHKQIEEEYKLGLADLSNRINGNQFRLWPRLAAAAILLLGISISLYFLKYKTDPIQQVVQHDIAPGGNKAYLTLADGQKISLTDAENGQVAKQTGVKIIKTLSGQLIYRVSGSINAPSLAPLISYNIIETPKGGQYEVILPDGTKVWLNAASSLKYPTSFTGNKRKVLLTGEAYFEVKHDRMHPFLVETDKETVAVLGTHFNVNAYNDEPSVKTTLLEGSVRVNTATTKIVIKPGQQAILIADKIATEVVDVEDVIAWKNGMFQFSDESLESIMRKVSRWYNVEIEYRDNEVKSLPLTGIITHFSNISKVLRMLELTKKVHFKIEKQKIIVTK